MIWSVTKGDTSGIIEAETFEKVLELARTLPEVSGEVTRIEPLKFYRFIVTDNASQ